MVHDDCAALGSSSAFTALSLGLTSFDEILGYVTVLFVF